MTQQEAVKRWQESAQRNLTIAEDMVRLGHYDWALFLGQLALEKLLKGLVEQRTDEAPPYIHDLVKLASIANLPLDESKKRELVEITRFHIQARYEDIKYQLSKEATKPYSTTWFAKIKALFIWIQKHY